LLEEDIAEYSMRKGQIVTSDRELQDATYKKQRGVGKERIK
jgi:hypothetical protein